MIREEKTLYLVRGLPGSGKTTLAQRLTKWVYSADDYFYKLGDGVYKFVPEDLPDAHKECQWQTHAALVAGIREVAVANTFSMAWEAEPYFTMAEEQGYTVCVIECQSQFDNLHGVPQSSIDNMSARWESLHVDDKENDDE